MITSQVDVKKALQMIKQDWIKIGATFMRRFRITQADEDQLRQQFGLLVLKSGKAQLRLQRSKSAEL